MILILVVQYLRMMHSRGTILLSSRYVNTGMPDFPLRAPGQHMQNRTNCLLAASYFSKLTQKCCDAWLTFVGTHFRHSCIELHPASNCAYALQPSRSGV